MDAQAIRKREAEETHKSDIVGETWAYMDKLCSCTSQVTSVELNVLKTKFMELFIETDLVEKNPPKKLFGPPAWLEDTTPSGAEVENQKGKHEEAHHRDPWKYVDSILSRSSGEITEVDMKNIKNSFGDFFRDIDLMSRTKLRIAPFAVKTKNVHADALNPSNSVGSVRAITKREAKETHQSDIVGETWAYMDKLCSCPSQVTSVELNVLKTKFMELFIETDLVEKSPPKKLFGPPAWLEDTAPSGAEAEIQKGKHEEAQHRDPWKYVDSILSRSSGEITEVDMKNIKNSFGDFFRDIDLMSRKKLGRAPFVVKTKNAIRNREVKETHQSDIVGETWAYMDKLCSCPSQVTSVELNILKTKFMELFIETDLVEKDPPKKLFGPPAWLEDTTPSGAEAEIQKGKHEEARHRDPWKYVDSILSRSSGEITKVDMKNIKNSFGDFFRDIDLMSRTKLRRAPFAVKTKNVDADALNPSNSVGPAKQEQMEEVTKCAEEIKKRELEPKRKLHESISPLHPVVVKRLQTADDSAPNPPTNAEASKGEH